MLQRINVEKFDLILIKKHIHYTKHCEWDAAIKNIKLIYSNEHININLPFKE